MNPSNPSIIRYNAKYQDPTFVSKCIYVRMRVCAEMKYIQITDRMNRKGNIESSFIKYKEYESISF